MKIISNYKDYYDAIQAYGIQSDLVYKRFQEEAEIPLSQKWIDISNALYSPIERILLGVNHYSNIDNNYIQVDSHILGFCGKIYGGFTFKTYKNNNLINQDTFYKLVDVKKYILNIQKEHKKTFVIESWYEQYGANSIDEIDFQKYFKWNNLPREDIEVFQDIQTPIFTIESQILQDSTEENKIKIIRNPNLKKLRFYRVFEAYLCFQEISQFLGGVLVIKENIESKMNDLDKVKQHGFDENMVLEKDQRRKYKL